MLLVADLLPRVRGHFAKIFRALRSDQARGGPSTSADCGFQYLAVARRHPGGLDMQAVVRFAFGGEQSARFVDSLFEDRNAERAPKPFAVVFGKVRLAGAHQCDERVSQGRNRR